MAYPRYLREKARELRTKKKLTIDELAERLALSRTTVYYWVRDIPIPRSRQHVGQRRGNRRMQVNYQRLRDEAYEEGRRSFSALARDPTFRDFVNLYIGEGYKRCRNVVSLANSDPAVVAIADRWIRRLAANPVTYAVQYHGDQSLDELRIFWGAHLGVPTDSIRFQRKSNSGRLKSRTWRSRHGVLTVTANDTYLRARLEAWMDSVKEQWLHSLASGA
jgi:excisionase family DNA binding protein